MGQCIDLYIERGKYLESMPDSALSERLVHLLNNCVKLDHKSMIQLCATEQPAIFARLLDTFAETTLRHGTVQAGQNPEAWKKANNAMISPSAEVAEKARKLKSLVGDEQGYLLRFSSFEFMNDLVYNGGVFLQSASAYKNQENVSVRDDELKLTLVRYLNPEEALSILHEVGGPSSMREAKLIEYSVTAPDFLTLCLTDSLNYRMISDWNAEAAVIIRDPNAFFERLRGASQKLHTEKHSLEKGKVRYIDPYFESYAKVQSEDLPFCKHFKFSYQREFRYVIRNSQKIENEDRKIYLGDISDIAMLVDLR